MKNIREEKTDRGIHEENITEKTPEQKKKTRIKLVALCVAVALLFVCCTAYWVYRVEGIGTKTVVSTPLYDEEETDMLKDNIRFENPVMAVINNFNDKKDAIMTVDGAPVPPEMFGFGLNTSGISCIVSLLETDMLMDMSDFDWNAQAFDTDLTYIEYVKGMALNNMIRTFGLIAAGEKNGVFLDDEDEKQIMEGIENLKKNYGETFEQNLHESGYPDLEALKTVQRIMFHANKVYDHAEKNLDQYITQWELKSKEEQEKVTVKHILIAFDEEMTGEVTVEKKAAALSEAMEVLAKIKAGEDFDKLMEEHNDDPGATPTGYTFANDGSMVKQFSDTAFAMEVGETSDLVETTYGYHILRKLERKYTVDDYLLFLDKHADVRIRKGNFKDAWLTIDIEKTFGGDSAK